MPRCDFDPTLTNVFAGAFDDAFNLLTIANPFYATLGSQANLRFQLANWFLVNSQLVEHGRSHLTAAAVVAFGSKEQQRHPLGTAITECPRATWIAIFGSEWRGRSVRQRAGA